PSRKRWYGNAGPQHSFPRGQIGFVDEIVVFYFKFRMLGKAHAEVEISSGTSTETCFSPPGDAQFLAVGNPGRNFDLIRVGLGDLPGAAAHVAHMLGTATGASTILAGHSMAHRNRAH